MEFNNTNENYVTNTTDIQTKGKRILRFIVLFFVLLFVYLLVKRLFFTKNEIETTSFPKVEVINAERGLIEKEVSVIGSIMPSDTYYVVPKVSGEILKIYVSNGDVVKKGDKICEIDNSKQIDAAKISLDATEKAFKRIQKLYKTGDVSAQNYEKAKAEYDGAKLQYDTQVEFATIISPGDGTIENTNMTKDTLVSQGTVLCYVTGSGTQKVEFGVTERILKGIKSGNKIVIEKNGEKYDGEITEVSELVSAKTGLFPISAIVNDMKVRFPQGTTCKVHIVTERSRNAYIIPRKLVSYYNGEPYIYILTDDNLAKRQFIKIGVENDDTTEVVSGVDRNTNIISTWNNDLYDGAKVEKLEVK